MNHYCGPKVTKVEFQNLQNGRPTPQLRISEIAKELEREFPLLEPGEIIAKLESRWAEHEQKRKQLLDGTLRPI